MGISGTDCRAHLEHLQMQWSWSPEDLRLRSDVLELSHQASLYGIPTILQIPMQLLMEHASAMHYIRGPQMWGQEGMECILRVCEWELLARHTALKPALLPAAEEGGNSIPCHFYFCVAAGGGVAIRAGCPTTLQSAFGAGRCYMV